MRASVPIMLVVVALMVAVSASAGPKVVASAPYESPSLVDKEEWQIETQSAGEIGTIVSRAGHSDFEISSLVKTDEVFDRATKAQYRRSIYQATEILPVVESKTMYVVKEYRKKLVPPPTAPPPQYDYTPEFVVVQEGTTVIQQPIKVDDFENVTVDQWKYK